LPFARFAPPTVYPDLGFTPLAFGWFRFEGRLGALAIPSTVAPPTCFDASRTDVVGPLNGAIIYQLSGWFQ